RMTIVGVERSFRVGLWGLLAGAAFACGCGPSMLGNPGRDAGPPDQSQPDVQPDVGQRDTPSFDARDAASPDWFPPDAFPSDTSPEPDPIARSSRYLASNRNVDLLFLVDDSSSMRLSQENLRRNFPVLMQTLKNQ